uniref:Putative DNA repair and recombination protein n=1 Tax=viral metagenome TaxID=1070528 RepID=A0A6M3XDU5_9ZZZZ
MSREEEIELTSIKGIGPVTAQKLKELDITVDKLAVLRPEELSSELNITKKAAKDICNDAKDKALPRVIPVRTFNEQKRHIKEVVQRIPTGSTALDDIMGGGWRTESLHLLKGEYSSGKTQLAMQAAINVLKYLKRKIIWIETETGSVAGDSVIFVYNKLTKEYRTFFIEEFVNLIKNNILESTNFETPSVSINGEIVWKSILDVYAHQNTGRMNNIKGFSTGSVQLTPNHSTMVLNCKEDHGEYKDKKIRIERADSITFNDRLIVPTSIEENPIDWKFNISVVNFLGSNQYSRSWKILCKKISLDKDLSFILGAYLAEGSMTSGKYIRFSLGKSDREKQFAEKISSSIFNIFDCRPSILYSREGYITVQLCNKFAFRLFADIFGLERKSSFTKNIPVQMFNTSIENRNSFYNGYLTGDGYFDNIKKKWKFFTVSKRLAYDMLYLYLQDGIPVSINKDDNGFSGFVLADRKQIRGIRYGSSIGKKIVYNRSYPSQEEVYDLCLGNKDEEDNFLVNGIFVHNTFSPGRFEEMAKAVGVTIDGDNDFIFIPSTGSSTPYMQYLSYQRAIQIMLEKKLDVGLIVVDSFNASFREFYSGREMLPDRAREEARHLGYLDNISAKYNIAVILTGQVMGIPDPGGQLGERVKTGHTKVAYGGDILFHWCTYIISLDQMSSEKGGEWEAVLADSPDKPRAKCRFRIVSAGVRDIIK